MEYSSVSTVESKRAPGVRFRIARMSFRRRVELMRRIRELGAKAEFLRAGSEPQEQMESALLQAEIDGVYLAWGLQAVEGLWLDGEPATAERLAEVGPEELVREALEAVKSETGLSEDERKN
jgi:hypothetical protein